MHLINKEIPPLFFNVEQCGILNSFIITNLNLNATTIFQCGIMWNSQPFHYCKSRSKYLPGFSTWMSFVPFLVFCCWLSGETLESQVLGLCRSPALQSTPLVYYPIVCSKNSTDNFSNSKEKYLDPSKSLKAGDKMNGEKTKFRIWKISHTLRIQVGVEMQLEAHSALTHSPQFIIHHDAK